MTVPMEISTELTPASSAIEPERFAADDRFVRALLSRMVGDPSRVDDLAQETWLAALRQSDARIVAKRAWLGTVARNFARQLTRGEVRRRRRENEVARPVVEEPRVVDGELVRRMREAMTSLPEHYRTVLHLRFYEDLPPTLIADRLEIPVETARTRLKRGLSALHALLIPKA